MNKEKMNRRIKEFIELVTKLGNLPKVWEYQTFDGLDQRLWFESITKLDKYQEFVKIIDNLLAIKGLVRLTDKQRETIFFEVITTIDRIPKKGKFTFADNLDMYSWYMSYRNKNKDYETLIHNQLSEYKELDLAICFTKEIKEEIINILEKLKRYPTHGEIKLSNNIDLAVMLDKLHSFDQIFYEKLLISLSQYNSKTINNETKQELFREKVEDLGYIPELGEERFIDGIDMYMWSKTLGKKHNPNLYSTLTPYLTNKNTHSR